MAQPRAATEFGGLMLSIVAPGDDSPFFWVDAVKNPRPFIISGRAQGTERFR